MAGRKVKVCSQDTRSQDIFYDPQSLLGRVLQPQEPPSGLRDPTERLFSVRKAGAEASNQQQQDSLFLVSEGLVERPFNYSMVPCLSVQNPHHATSIRSKVRATVGLGFPMEKSKQARLDAITDMTFEDLMSDVMEDFYEYGVGYIEVVRNPEGKIVGLYHLSAARTWVYLEDQRGVNYHYAVFDQIYGVFMPGVVAGQQVNRSVGLTGGQRFAKFGDKDRMLSAGWATEESPERTSEVVTFRNPSNKSRWYGFPGWLSAVPRIQLSNGIIQFQQDFFKNRGVPEFLLFVTGVDLDAEDWNEIKGAIQRTTGHGNSHRTLAMNIGHPEVQVTVERLAMEVAADPIQFSKSNETIAVEIVSAHGVPPLMAGIQITGKLGAANELPNALMSFQALEIGPVQILITKVLNVTLAQDLHGIEFKEPKKITDSMDLKKLDTTSRMRETIPEAQVRGRPLDALLR